jgi:hypothetical protein
MKRNALALAVPAALAACFCTAVAVAHGDKDEIAGKRGTGAPIPVPRGGRSAPRGKRD